MTEISRRRFGALTGAIAGALLPKLGRAVEGAEHIVEIRQFAFAPARLTIRSGDRVVWVNRDLAPHTATARRGDWDTGELGRDETAAVSLGTPGAYPYTCLFHPRMRGEIIVTNKGDD